MTVGSRYHALPSFFAVRRVFAPRAGRPDYGVTVSTKSSGVQRASMLTLKECTWRVEWPL
jgi:hypothetical protein